MLSLDEARARLLSNVRRLAAERVALGESVGRVVAQDLAAEQGLPPFDYSAMDGYALRTADISRDAPWTLPVVGQSSAGATPPVLGPMAASRIFTGAQLPRGADTVVMQENATRAGDL